MNKKGFITPILALTIMFTSFIALTFAYSSVTSTNVRIHSTKDPVSRLVNNQTLRERVTHLLATKPDHSSTEHFRDIGGRVVINETSNKHPIREVEVFIYMNDNNESTNSQKMFIRIDKSKNIQERVNILSVEQLN